MPDEMREYQNQEMEGNESPVPQEAEERSVEGIQNEQAPFFYPKSLFFGRDFCPYSERI